jgi:hypothetical protein
MFTFRSIFLFDIKILFFEGGDYLKSIEDMLGRENSFVPAKY